MQNSAGKFLDLVPAHVGRGPLLFERRKIDLLHDSPLLPSDFLCSESYLIASRQLQISFFLSCYGGVTFWVCHLGRKKTDSRQKEGEGCRVLVFLSKPRINQVDQEVQEKELCKRNTTRAYLGKAGYRSTQYQGGLRQGTPIQVP